MIWHTSKHKDNKNDKTIELIGELNDLDYNTDRIIIKIKYEENEKILYSANPQVPDDIEPNEVLRTYHAKIRKAIKLIESGNAVIK